MENNKSRKYHPRVCSSEDFSNKLKKYCNFFTGVPDSVLKNTQKNLTEYKFSSRENHAVGIAFGASLSSKKPCVLIQNSGLGLAIDSLLGLFSLYEKGLLIVVSNRGELDWEEIQHKDWGDLTIDLIESLKFKIFDFETDGIESIEKAANYAFGKEKIAILLIHRGNLDE